MQSARPCLDLRHRRARGAAGARCPRGVYAADLAPLPSQERISLQFRTAQLPADITQFVLAKDEAAFVGEVVAVVIAETAMSPRTQQPLSRSTMSRCLAVSDC